MKKFGPRSFTRGHAALIIFLFLAFLGLFSISRSFAQGDFRKESAATVRSQTFGPFDYAAFQERESRLDSVPGRRRSGGLTQYPSDQ